MNNGVERANLEQAVENLKNRTLTAIPGGVARLIYLASTRDYTSGRYYHDGLAFQYSEEVAGQALARCHQEIFRQLTSSSLEHIVQQLEAFVKSTGAPPAEVLAVWKKLEPYRLTIPADSDLASAELFFSNIKVALAILATRQGTS